MKIIMELKEELDKYPILWVVDAAVVVWCVCLLWHCIDPSVGL